MKVAAGAVSSGRGSVSGPLLDRMTLCARRASDIHLDVRSVPYQKLSSPDSGEPSSAIRKATPLHRVQAALFRHLGKPSMSLNGDMGGSSHVGKATLT